MSAKFYALANTRYGIAHAVHNGHAFAYVHDALSHAVNDGHVFAYVHDTLAHDINDGHTLAYVVHHTFTYARSISLFRVSTHDPAIDYFLTIKAHS